MARILRHSRLLAYSLFGLMLMSLPAHAVCSGASPNWTAASTSSTDVQACFNVALQCNDTVNIPAGSSTWSTQVTLSPPTGCAVNKGVKVVGATTCTPNAAGSRVTSCTDNTNITLAVAGNQTLSITGVSSTSFLDISGITFITSSNFSNGEMQLDGTHGSVGFRLHHLHLKGTVAGAHLFIILRGLWGEADHILFDDSVVGAPSIPFNVYGDLGTSGYLDWNQPTNFGTNQAVYIEDSTFNFQNANASEGVFDAYEGAKVVVRYSKVAGATMGGNHGTDSGPFRSAALMEIYNNIFDNTSASPIVQVVNSRGGVAIFANNTVTSSGGGSWGAFNLQLYRQQLPNQVGTFGTLGPGLNWVTTAANGNTNTLNAGDWTGSHTYNVGDVIGPTSNNAGAYNYVMGGTSWTPNTSYAAGAVVVPGTSNGHFYLNTSGALVSGTTEPTWSTSGGTASDGVISWQDKGTTGASSGSRPNPFTQTFGATTVDSTAYWVNVGGTTAAGTQKYCAVNPDTQCTSNATCSALSGGDTCSRFFDSNGGVYPYRDQPCVGHNQVVTPCYAWGNSGAALPNPVWGQAFAPTSTIQVNRDYFNNTAMPGYTAYTYPHPLQGGAVAPTLSVTVVGSGSVSSSPAGISCPALCSSSFTAGTNITLTPTPNSTFSFLGWSGGCSGLLPCSFTLNSNLSATATFSAPISPVTAPCPQCFLIGFKFRNGLILAGSTKPSLYCPIAVGQLDALPKGGELTGRFAASSCYYF